MPNLSLTQVFEIVFLIAVAALIGFLFSTNTALKLQNSQNLVQISELQSKLSKCNTISNIIDIRKIKGKNTTSIEQLLRIQKVDTVSHVGSCNNCDTLGVVAWFCELPRHERRKLEKVSNKDP